mmetsp:Transcript_77404/g.250503  ORF Transcript_77404/g.250503 Transcript_77404/m.250503 type:complete len:219 (-) Transcript_77404:433-1089(-)
MNGHHLHARILLQRVVRQPHGGDGIIWKDHREPQEITAPGYIHELHCGARGVVQQSPDVFEAEHDALRTNTNCPRSTQDGDIGTGKRLMRSAVALVEIAGRLSARGAVSVSLFSECCTHFAEFSARRLLDDLFGLHEPRQQPRLLCKEQGPHRRVVPAASAKGHRVQGAQMCECFQPHIAFGPKLAHELLLLESLSFAALPTTKSRPQNRDHIVPMPR